MLNPKKWRAKIAEGAALPSASRPMLWKILSGSAAEKEKEGKAGCSFEEYCGKGDSVAAAAAFEEYCRSTGMDGTTAAAAAAAAGLGGTSAAASTGNAIKELATAVERRGGGDEVNLLGRAARALLVRHEVAYCPGMLDSLAAIARVIGGCGGESCVCAWSCLRGGAERRA